jgi:ectoine hydroxylase-related dioxygenase (phytanoyl-CoA dioxygenase family)
MMEQNAALRSQWLGVPTRSSLHLSHEQVVHYDRHGYLLVEDVFSPKEIRLIKESVPELVEQRSERTVLEASGETVRSVYSIHRNSRTFAHLANHPRMVEPARHLLDSDVYVYQSKLNTKAVFDGDAWPWHQDYVYWLEEDGMPAPRALTAAVFLDEVTELNGPMMVIPGSNHEGMLGFDSYQGQPRGYEDAPDWIANVVARMKYTIDKKTFLALARDNGVVPIKGRAGSVLFFDCNLAHASPPNLSPFERTLALYTYNRCDNAPPAAALRRPDFLVERDTRPIVPESDHVLRAVITRAP